MRPRGLMHTFWNAGPSRARLLEIIATAGFEPDFPELAEAEIRPVGRSWQPSTA